ncbi:MAG TPA: cytochrome c3 family protein, partial [Longimicrobiales bacterium]|nr:cytochrome c3 family protein [Longimicrobiales bacterium]
MSPRGAALAGVLLVGAHLSGCAGADEGAGDPTFVGRQACVPCHQRESAAYRGSDHDRALAVAAEETVLADFSGASFTHGSTTYRFDRPDGRFVVTIEEEDAAGQELEVLYAVGFEPLQQDLVALPGGRLQRLGVSWDTRPPDEGGGRWFHVHGEEEVRRDDLLHWSRSSQNWNRMCAACHSTNVRKNYDPETRAYATSWSEIDVSCEACHGPASAHLAWADAGADGSGRAPGRGRGFAAGLPQTRDEACARCHSHRTRIAEDRPGGRFLDAYRISLPREPLYHPDGAVREEVFVYGSFLQSRMYQAGVRCTDCHDPHTAGLRERDNALCTGCHEAGRYDGPGHSFHEKESARARCVGCHMPTTTFMGVDARRDHRFGTPRPGLPDGPNACLACHREGSVPWVSARIDEW